MMDTQAIIDYAELVSDALAREFAERPRLELCAWLRMAHQREAMVTCLDDVPQLELRLARCTERELAAVVRSAVTGIWAHEESHTRWLGSLRSLTDPLAGVAEWQGRLEGYVTRRAVSPRGALARTAIAAGLALGQIPDFAGQLRELALPQLFRFYAALETTARNGYRRMLDLFPRLGLDDREALREIGATFAYDLARIHCEEAFHQDAFALLASWVDPNASSRPRSARACTEALYDLCERHLSITSAQQRLRPGSISKDAGPALWISHGGLGLLFREQGFEVPLAQDVSSNGEPTP